MLQLQLRFVASVLLLWPFEAHPENGGIFDHPGEDEWVKYGCGTEAETGMAACFCGFLRDAVEVNEGESSATVTTANGMVQMANAITTSTTCNGGLAGSFPCANVDLLAHLPLSTFGSQKANDVWGWTHSGTGREFAMIGLSEGTAFVEITNPTNPKYLGNLPTHTVNSSWRDVKVYKDHAFIGSEANGHGMQVLDLKQLLTKSGTSNFQVTAHYNGIGSSHNIAINEESGYAYVVGSNQCNGGLHMVDISTPGNPKYAGCYSSDGYTHDAHCVIYKGPDAAHKGKEICFACNEDTVTVVDVTNKSSPTQLNRKSYAKTGEGICAT
jgi:choice-of-anchor B domain-containing protein